MITRITGEVIETTDGGVTIQVAGFGIRLLVPARSAGRAAVGREATFATVFEIKEDQAILYGFGDEAEREAFTELRKVKGVGARIALGLLGLFRPDEIWGLIVAKDHRMLTTVSGCGRRLADRIVLELKDTAARLATSAEAMPKGLASGDFEGCVQAMVNLGWQRQTAHRALMKAAKENPDADTGELLRHAIRSMPPGNRP